jgi:hypothetical protein
VVDKWAVYLVVLKDDWKAEMKAENSVVLMVTNSAELKVVMLVLLLVDL